MATQAEKISKLEKDVALISERLLVIKDNHLKHINQDLSMIKKVLWSTGFLLLSNLLALLFYMYR